MRKTLLDLEVGINLMSFVMMRRICDLEVRHAMVTLQWVEK